MIDDGNDRVTRIIRGLEFGVWCLRCRHTGV